MTISALSPIRIVTEALVFIGAVFLAGILVHAQQRTAARMALRDEEVSSFDDSGIPLRLAALSSLRAIH
jgi:hypothetical protein